MAKPKSNYSVGHRIIPLWSTELEKADPGDEALELFANNPFKVDLIQRKVRPDVIAHEHNERGTYPSLQWHHCIPVIFVMLISFCLEV